MNEPAPGGAVLRCTECGRAISLCAFCDTVDCGTAMCFRCVSRALSQAVPDPHTHGG